MKKLLLSITVLGMFSINAFACEGWKSEYAKLGLKISAYSKTYANYAKGKYNEEKFNTKKEKLLTDIEELKNYVNSTESCSGKENRKIKLQSWISKVIDVIKSNSEEASNLAKQIHDDF